MKFILPFFGESKLEPDINTDNKDTNELDALKSENEILKKSNAQYLLEMECVEMENRKLRSIKKSTALDKIEKASLIPVRLDSGTFSNDHDTENEMRKLKRLLELAEIRISGLKNENINLMLAHDRELGIMYSKMSVLQNTNKDLTLKLKLEMIQNRRFIEQYRQDTLSMRLDLEEFL